MSDRKPIKIQIGGPDDPFPDFPSTTTARAKRHFESEGKPLEIFSFGHYVISFIEKHCVLTDSHYAGQPFKLMDWQKRYCLEQFEVIQKEGSSQWLRKHRWGLAGIPKKTARVLV